MLRLSRWGVAIVLAAIAGIALRVWTYRSALGVPNADEAVVGLMTRHILHGQIPVFYWGQTYGGSQEALLTAPLFYVFGSSWLALRIVPLILGAVAAVIVWRVGLRIVGERAAIVGAAVFWIWPGLQIFNLTHQLGFYASNVFYCALLLLLALRVVERPDSLRVGLFGLVAGLGFWQTAQIVPIEVGVILWMIWKRPQFLRQLWLAVPLAALGALPWIVWNARHGWASLHMAAGGGIKVQSLRLLASPVLPMVFGFRAPFSAQLLLPTALTFLAYLVLIAAFVYGAVKSRRENVSILYFVAIVFPFVYILSSKAVYGAPRFALVLTPLFALLAAQLARSFPRAIALLVITTAVSVITLYRMEKWFTATPPKTTYAHGVGPRHVSQWVPRNLAPLVSTLDRLHLKYVYADYWIAYRLDFDTRERIVASSSYLRGVTIENGNVLAVEPLVDRWPPYTRAVDRARHAFVFYRKIVSTSPIIAQLRSHGYRAHTVDTLVVYAPRA